MYAMWYDLALLELCEHNPLLLHFSSNIFFKNEITKHINTF